MTETVIFMEKKKEIVSLREQMEKFLSMPNMATHLDSVSVLAEDFKWWFANQTIMPPTIASVLILSELRPGGMNGSKPVRLYRHSDSANSQHFQFSLSPPVERPQPLETNCSRPYK